MLFRSIFGGKADINSEVEACRSTPGAVLIDVREADEYAAGRIPGSVSLPLSSIRGGELPDFPAATPLFVYCLGGTRSSMAADLLKQAGFTDIHDIGGIRSWKGDIEK